jgi:hypothetical protein
MIIYRVLYDYNGQTLAKYAKNKKEAMKIRTQLKKQEKEEMEEADDGIGGQYIGISDVGEPKKMDLGYSKAEVVAWLNNWCEVVV